MDISIKITSKKPEKCEGRKALKGLIEIGNSKETICVHLNQWTQEDYERQWREGLDRLKNHNISCLVVSVNDPNDPKASTVIEWWPLYRVDNAVLIQNEKLSKKSYKKIVGKSPFTPETCYDFITPRETHTKDGHEISEWSVPWTE